MSNQKFIIDRNTPYVKLLDRPVVEEYNSYKSRDELTDKIVQIIIENNDSENTKIILKNLQSVTIKDKTLLYKLVINPIFGKKFKVAAAYAPYRNEIVFYKNNELVIAHEMLHMASTVTRNKEVHSGFIQIFKPEGQTVEIGRGLTEGYTSLEADRLFGPLENNYYLEKDIAKKLEQIVGKEKMRKFYYTADLLGLVKELKKYDYINNVIDLITDIDFVKMMKDKKTRVEKSKEIYLKLYQYNSIKRRRQYDKGLISEEDYERLTLEFSKLYTLNVMRLFDYQDIIKEEDRTL